MSDELVKRARNALDGVTEGPWHWNVSGFVGPSSTENDQSFGMICDEVAECTNYVGNMEANAHFIAASRNLVPAMADRLEELEALLAKAVEALAGVNQFVLDLSPFADPSHSPATALTKACVVYVELSSNMTGGNDE